MVELPEGDVPIDSDASGWTVGKAFAIGDDEAGIPKALQGIEIPVVLWDAKSVELHVLAGGQFQLERDMEMGLAETSVEVSLEEGWQRDDWEGDIVDANEAEAELVEVPLP